MNEYCEKKLRELLSETAQDTPYMARVLAGEPLSDAVCAMLGMEPERLNALASGAEASPLERIGLYTAAEYLTYPMIYPKTAYPSYGFPKTWDGAHPLFCDALVNDLLDEDGLPLAVTLRDRWMSGVMGHIIREREFCRELIRFSGETDENAFLQSCHFFMDGSALCSGYMADFLDYYLSKAKSPGMPTQVVVPQMVVSRIEEMADSQSSEELALVDAVGGREQLRRIQDAGMLSVRGDKGESALLSTFMSALARYKPLYRIALLTQDRTLANAIRVLNESGVEGKDILIARLTEGGYPVMWFEEETSSDDLKPVRADGETPDASALEERFNMIPDEEEADYADDAETKIAFSPAPDPAEMALRAALEIASESDSAADEQFSGAPEEEEDEENSGDGEDDDEDISEEDEDEEDGDDEDAEMSVEGDDTEMSVEGDDYAEADDDAELSGDKAMDTDEEELLAAIGRLNPTAAPPVLTERDISTLRLEPVDGDQSAEADAWQGLP